MFETLKREKYYLYYFEAIKSKIMKTDLLENAEVKAEWQNCASDKETYMFAHNTFFILWIFIRALVESIFLYNTEI